MPPSVAQCIVVIHNMVAEYGKQLIAGLVCAIQPVTSAFACCCDSTVSKWQDVYVSPMRPPIYFVTYTLPCLAIRPCQRSAAFMHLL